MQNLFNNQKEPISTSVSEITNEETGVLESNYCYDKFSEVEYQTSVHRGIKFFANLHQQLNYNEGSNAPILNNYASNKFIYAKNNFIVENTFDLQGNISGKIQGDIQAKPFEGCKAYFKTQTQNLERGIFNFSLGMFLNEQNYAAKAKYNYEKGSIQALAKGKHEIQPNETLGGILGLSLKVPSLQFSIYKMGIWYQDEETKMAVIHQIPQQNEVFKFTNLKYSVFKKMNSSADLGISMAYNSLGEKSYKMKVGTRIKKQDNLEYGFKIDDSFNLSTYLKLDVSNNAIITLSNKIDLNLKAKREYPSLNQFPFGFKVVLKD